MKIYCYIFILYITATTVTAVPTEFARSDRNSKQSMDMSFSSSSTTISAENELANIGKRFLQPPDADSVIKNPIQPVSKVLPNAPAAILLGVVGFLCVTGIKDRKEWFTALATILWLSQAGITALPKLIPRHHAEKHAKLLLSLGKANASLFKKSSRLRSEVERSRYISILRHLSSIPDHHTNLISNINISQPVILYKRNTINTSLSYSAVKIERFNCFSLTSIFSNLSRGPPSIS